ncbi:MAG: hypothetical protein ACTSYF_05545, partial [Promethearchaeota archaeon]
MGENMKNKEVILGLVIILILLVLVNISTFRPQLQEQKEAPTREEFSVRTSQDPNVFISIWDTTKTSAGSSGSKHVCLPLESNGTYAFIVDWGDDSNDTITIWNQLEVTHTYASEGIYTINITGMIVGWRFNNGGDKLKILEIQQWGCLRLGNSGTYFYGCSNLEHTATDILNLTGTTNLYRAFMICRNLGNNGNMSSWDVSSVT